MNKAFNVLMAAAICFAACNNPQKETPQTESAPKSDILVDDIDSTVNPADDFFDYANGGWIKKNPIPGDETSWGIAKLVQEELYSRLKHINEDALAKNEKSGTSQQIADFWYSGMDTTSIEQKGLEPLAGELSKINALQTPKDIMAYTAHMHTYGVGVFFGEGVGQDLKASDVNAYYMSQGGLGMPNRDYYFNTDARTTKVRQAYPGYVATIFRLMGADSNLANKKAAAVMALETKLARSSRKLEDLRDPYKNYHKMAISSLNKISSHIDWPQTLQQIGVQHVDSVIVGQPEFYHTLDEVIAKENIATLRDYMAFHLVSDFSAYLSKPFVDAHFDFYSKTLRGAEQQRPRWKRVLDSEEGAIGEALGQLFAKEYFNEMAKKRYELIVENVRTAYKNRMEKLDWMSDSTKQKALHKLATIHKKVGYPDKWKDFSALKIDRGPYALNMMRANEWWNNYSLNKLGKPVDREEWDMTPQTYNAYYNPSNNEIVLPAGIFTVPGYRDEELDDALVYGYAAASTVGHEITHGFDDEGRQYDENGNLRNWWSKEDEEQFNKRAAVLVKQFNAFTPVDSLHINGKATLGENLADLGGILIGLDAFKMTETYKKGEKISGFTPVQRFFLGYSLGWLYSQRKAELATRLLTDVHSPAKYRVNGPFPNVPEFYEAFHVTPANKMYIADSARVKLW
ncbi:MAG: metalloendopeptidase [Bacteroidetes bacterium 46-16]|nr:MAG: metalloendopeptidase [Bacteroidetes bacterium 46-16]